MQRPAFLRHVAGGMPNSRLNARLNAASDSYPTCSAMTAYAGTAAPINFNGLVRRYYLRQAPENGDLQVNLADRHERTRKVRPWLDGPRPRRHRGAEARSV